MAQRNDKTHEAAPFVFWKLFSYAHFTLKIYLPAYLHASCLVCKLVQFWFRHIWPFYIRTVLAFSTLPWRTHHQPQDQIFSFVISLPDSVYRFLNPSKMRLSHFVIQLLAFSTDFNLSFHSSESYSELVSHYFYTRGGNSQQFLAVQISERCLHFHFHSKRKSSRPDFWKGVHIFNFFKSQIWPSRFLKRCSHLRF